jgi:hypothetical protein
VSLTVREAGWAFAVSNAPAIEEHWRARKAENPTLFNGRVFLMEAGGLAGDRFEAVLRPIDFKAFLFWKERAGADRHGLDCFGSALLVSREGHVLLGRAAGHTINEGLIYPPGGFFDERDVAGGRIDLEASVRREVVEETGLPTEWLTPEPHAWVTRTGAQISLAVEYRLPLSSAELRSAIMKNLSKEAVPELDDIVVVRSAADLANPSISLYARVLLEVVLGQ